jgi:hypothetical protein
LESPGLDFLGAAALLVEALLEAGVIVVGRRGAIRGVAGAFVLAAQWRGRAVILADHIVQ